MLENKKTKNTTRTNTKNNNGRKQYDKSLHQLRENRLVKEVTEKEKDHIQEKDIHHNITLEHIRKVKDMDQEHRFMEIAKDVE